MQPWADGGGVVWLRIPPRRLHRRGFFAPHRCNRKRPAALFEMTLNLTLSPAGSFPAGFFVISSHVPGWLVVYSPHANFIRFSTRRIH
jgi:hypothetical protein